jgi:thiamine-phosphate pyrophosphorylase
MGCKAERKTSKEYLGGLCFITDRSSCQLTCVEMTEMVLRAGAKWVQYRDKNRDRLGVYRTAMHLRELTRAHGAYFIVNDHADIAVAVDADGVHLGQNDFPLGEARKLLGEEKIIGISTHSLEEALDAEADGADYVGFGPIYSTKTKYAGSPRGAEMLRSVRGKVKIPVVAIGGIDVECLAEVMASGAGAVAVASSILDGANIGTNVQRFIAGIMKCMS